MHRFHQGQEVRFQHTFSPVSHSNHMVFPHVFIWFYHMGVSIQGGTPIAEWFISWKISLGYHIDISGSLQNCPNWTSSWLQYGLSLVNMSQQWLIYSGNAHIFPPCFHSKQDFFNIFPCFHMFSSFFHMEVSWNRATPVIILSNHPF